MNRRSLAVLVLLSWVAAMAWQVRRVYMQPDAERLAAAARTLPPGVAYYTLSRGDERAGWARTDIDTLPAASGFHVTDRFVIRLPGLGAAGESEIRVQTWLDQTLNMSRFEIVDVRSGDTARSEGTVVGDSLIRIERRAAGRTDGTSLRIPGPVTTATGWPLRLAAAAASRTGDEFTIDVFDPVSWGVRAVQLRVLEEATRVFADSADLDTIAGRWYLAGEDTVEAWLVGEMGREGATWVDEDGRIIEGPVRGGLRRQRTAFEIAFFGDAMVLGADTTEQLEEQR